MTISKIPKNYVLVDFPSNKHESIALKNGKELYIDNTFEPEKHSVNYGKVLLLPDRLHYSGIAGDNGAMEYDIDIEIQVGDIAYFHYLESGKIPKEGRVVDHDGKRCAMVRYDRIFCVRRGNDIIMTNGWVLIEPVKETKIISDVIIVPDSIQAKFKAKEGIVAYCGTPVKAYAFRPTMGGDTDEIKPGDHILYSDFSNIPLEYGLHETMPKKYFRMQRKDIIGVYA